MGSYFHNQTRRTAEGAVFCVGGAWACKAGKGEGNMVLTEALEAYGKYFKSIAIMVLPVGILVGLILLGISNSRNETMQLMMAFNVPGWLLSPFWIGPLICGLSLYGSEQEFSYKTAVHNGLRPWWKLMTVALIVIGIRYIPVAVGEIFPELKTLILLFTWVIVAFLFALYVFIWPVLALESRGPLETLRRCAALSKGKRVNIIFEFIALWLLIYVVSFIMRILLGALANLIGGMASTYITFILIIGMIQPMMYALIVVWIYFYYLECRGDGVVDNRGDKYDF